MTDPARPAGDDPADETAGPAAGETAGPAAGETAGPAAGEAAGRPVGEAAGPAAGEAPAAPPRDPWKGLRGVMAGTLILETIVVALALPVVANLEGGISSAAGWATGALTLLMLVAAFTQRRPWGLGLALALQVVMIAMWPLVTALGILGVIFALVWLYILWLRQDLRRRLGEHAAAAAADDAGPAPAV